MAEVDLEAEGLYGMSYDSFFSIEKRVRKIQDIHIPTRSGVTVPQVQTFFLVLVLSFLFQVLILGQVMSLLGIPGHWLLFVLVVLGPPFLCSWRVVRPMPHGKSIPGTVQSMLGFHLDDTVHRRGRPVKTPKQPADAFVQHYQRDWTINQEFALEVPGEGDWTDPETERRFGKARGEVHLQDWMDEKAIAHFESESEKKHSRTKKEITVHDRRGPAATVTDF